MIALKTSECSRLICGESLPRSQPDVATVCTIGKSASSSLSSRIASWIGTSGGPSISSASAPASSLPTTTGYEIARVSMRSVALNCVSCSAEPALVPARRTKLV